MNSLVSLISQLRDVAWRETTTLLVPHPAVRAWVCMASAVTTVLVLVVRVRRILTTWRAPGKSIQAGATTAWTVRVTRRPCELVGSGVAWDVFPGQALQSVVETRLVGLHGQDAVLVCDLFGGVTGCGGRPSSPRPLPSPSGPEGTGQRGSRSACPQPDSGAVSGRRGDCGLLPGAGLSCRRRGPRGWSYRPARWRVCRR